MHWQCLSINRKLHKDEIRRQRENALNNCVDTESGSDIEIDSGFSVSGRIWKKLYRWVRLADVLFSSSAMHYRTVSLQCFDVVWRQDWHPTCKKWVLVCWWWWFDWSFARLIASDAATTSIILSSNKIQDGDILVPANQGPPGKMVDRI